MFCRELIKMLKMFVEKSSMGIFIDQLAGVGHSYISYGSQLGILVVAVGNANFYSRSFRIQYQIGKSSQRKVDVVRIVARDLVE